MFFDVNFDTDFTSRISIQPMHRNWDRNRKKMYYRFVSTFASNDFTQSKKTLILLGFYYFRATGFRQYALCRNSWYISVCMAVVAWDRCRTACSGFPCAKTKNIQSMSNGLSNRKSQSPKVLMLLPFCCFRATGNQTDALNPNFRQTHLFHGLL